MGQIVLTKRVDAPVERVFPALLDLEHAPRRIPSIKRIEILTPGPVGKGTKFRETRLMFGKEATETLEIADVQPGRSITITATSCGSFFSTEFRLVPQGDSTLIEQVTSWKPLTLFARLMAPMSLLMKGTMKKMMQGDLDGVASAIARGE